MNTRKFSKYVCMIALCSCDPQLVDDPIPIVAFTDLVINLNLPEYIDLRTEGGFKEVNNKGVRGIIVYRAGPTSFRAYERNCSFHPNEAGSTVDVHTSRLYMVDPSCGSTFSWGEGTPMGGPAWRPLRQYRTQHSGTTLTITDEVIN